MGWGGDSNPSLRITTVDAQPSYPNAARGGFEPPTIALTGRCTTSCAIWQKLGTEDSNPHLQGPKPCVLPVTPIPKVKG